MLKEKRGITLIALVITIIVLLILAGVSIAMLTGENGILTKASEASIENTHATVKDAISLAYSEYQIQINSTETTTNFWDFLVGKIYIDGTTGIVDTEALTGENLSLGRGTENSDVYKIEEESDMYVLKYYDENQSPKILWQVNLSGQKELSDTELQEIILKEEDGKYVDTYGNVYENVWDYYVYADGVVYLDGDGEYEMGYSGQIIEGVLEYPIPAYIKAQGEIYKVSGLGSYVFNTGYGYAGNVPDLEEIFIPKNIESIASDTFSAASDLKKIIIDNSQGTITGEPWGAPDTTEIIWQK